MKRLVLLAALLGASTIVPAFALTEHNLVPISGTRDTDANWQNFRAPIHETSFAAPMASESFGRWDDRSVMISDSPDVRAIALKPQDADAQCRNMTASFNDGSSVNLPVNGGQTMQEGSTYNVPVDGRYRGLNAVGLTCEAENGRAVTIDIYGVG